MYCERSIGDQVSNFAGLVFALFFINMVFDFVGISWLDVPDVIRGHFNQLGGFADRASVYTNRYPIGF
jgi:hypothetical protein